MSMWASLVAKTSYKKGKASNMLRNKFENHAPYSRHKDKSSCMKNFSVNEFAGMKAFFTPLLHNFETFPCSSAS